MIIDKVCVMTPDSTSQALPKCFCFSHIMLYNSHLFFWSCVYPLRVFRLHRHKGHIRSRLKLVCMSFLENKYIKKKYLKKISSMVLVGFILPNLTCLIHRWSVPGSGFSEEGWVLLGCSLSDLFQMSALGQNESHPWCFNCCEVNL